MLDTGILWVNQSDPLSRFSAKFGTRSGVRWDYSRKYDFKTWGLPDCFLLHLDSKDCFLLPPNYHQDCFLFTHDCFYYSKIVFYYLKIVLNFKQIVFYWHLVFDVCFKIISISERIVFYFTKIVLNYLKIVFYYTKIVFYWLKYCPLIVFKCSSRLFFSSVRFQKRGGLLNGSDWLR